MAAVGQLDVTLDGVEITRCVQTTQWRPRFNVLDSAIIRYPTTALSCSGITVEEGVTELAIYLDGDVDPAFAGPVWYSSAEGEPDSAYVELTGWDHRIYLGKLLCKSTSDPGNLITPGDVILTQVTAPEILAEYIANAIADTDAAVFDPFGPFGPTGPSAGLPLTVGTVDTGGADCTGVPTNFPMSIERMRALLTSTGQLDQILTPGLWDGGSGPGSTLDLLNDYDNDLSSTVRFEYATGAHNCQVATYTVDMKDVINALWYLLGPRINEQRWRGSITPTAPHPGDPWPTGLLQRISDSRILYGYMQEIQVFDDKSDENDVRPLFEEEWANEAWIRTIPRTFASIRPERGASSIPNFRVGDVIGVAAGSILNGGFDGSEMVYGFDLNIDADGVYSMEEIITSADQAGATGSVA